MGLVNSEVAIATVQSYRLVWISGRFGGGKTSLAFKLAEHFLKYGYRLVTNSRCVWADDINNIQLDEDNHLKAVVVLDEGGLWFKSSKQIEMIASYAAKMDVIYLLPSFWPPTRSAQVLVIQPIFNLMAAGVPSIFYRWRVKIGSFDDKGWFLWNFPEEIYGIYSRQDPGDSGAEIVEFLIERTNEYRERHGRKDEFSEMESGISETERFADSVETLAQAADVFASIPIRKRRGRGI
jgi:hypothetical protein